MEETQRWPSISNIRDFKGLEEDVKGSSEGCKEKKGNLGWSFQACPIWWRGEAAKCEYVWSERQQLPLSAGVPSDRDLTSSWCEAVSCSNEVASSDSRYSRLEKRDMTVAYFWKVHMKRKLGCPFKNLSLRMVLGMCIFFLLCTSKLAFLDEQL